MMEEIVETLNNVFETYQRQIKRLENRTKEGSLWVETIVQAQEAYHGLSKLLVELTRGLEEFKKVLLLIQKAILFYQSMENRDTGSDLKMLTNSTTELELL